MSYRSLNIKPLNSSLKTLLKRSGHIGVGLGAFAPVLALANPSGGQVTAGTATLGNPSANGMVIKQSSASAIINWQQFNIGAGQYVQFLQPSSSSVVLNRVIGGSPSSILGSLTANGQVFLVNTNGVYFGKTSSIDAQGFLASSLGITDRNFLSRNYVFDQPAAPGATVVNEGNITANHDGYVVLAGDYSENDGIISAQSGHVILASGSKATLSLNGNSLINFAVSQSTLANYAGVKNAGSILADGGTVIMTADVANALKATVVNNTGLVEAHVMSNSGGVIKLLASGGDIANAGTLDASGTRAGQAGGDITLKGDERTVLTDTSKIDATGQGTNGGSVEVSGNTIAMRGAMNLGKGGKLLLDPESIQLVTTGGTGELGGGTTSTLGTIVSKIGVDTIQTQLNAGATVAISAHHLIDASGGVTAITATGKGNLSFKVNTTSGVIQLGGVDITIGGNLTASMHTGTFGHLTAGSMGLNAGGGIQLERATANSHGAITKFSAKTTTGGLTLTAGFVGLDGTGTDGLALQAKTALTVNGDIGTLAGLSGAFPGNIALMGATVADHGNIVTIGKFNAVAGAGDLDIRNVTAKQGVTLTDKNGALFAGSNSIAFISASHDVTINAKNIEHVGSGYLVLQTGLLIGDTLTVNGVFGANAAAGFGHQLVLNGHTINVNNDIKASQLSIFGTHLVYTGKNTTFGLSASAGKLVQDASIGSAAAAVKYNVAISGKDDLVEIQRSIYAGNTAGKAAANISLSETGLDGSNPVGVLISFPGTEAVTLSAKGNITVTGQDVEVHAGDAVAFNGNSFNGTVNRDAGVTLKAGRNVTLQSNGGSGSVKLLGGSASAGAIGANIYTRLAVANAGITVNAGKAISLTAHQVKLSAGSAFAEAFANGSAHNTATADASIILNAGTNVTMTATGGNITIKAAGPAHKPSASNGYATAQFTKATATANGDVDVTAGGISLAATNVTVEAGSGVGILGIHAPSGDNAHASDGAVVKFIATGNVDFTARAGGIAINAYGGTANIKGGNETGSGAKAEAIFGGSASMDLEARVDFTTSGSMQITGKDVNIQAGTRAAARAIISGSYGGIATLDADQGVNLSAKGAMIITAASDLRIDASGAQADLAQVHSQIGGRANLTATGAVTLQAGSVSITGSNSTQIEAGYGAARGAAVQASTGGQAKLDAESNVSISATTGNLSLKGKNNLSIRGGSNLGAGYGTHELTGSSAAALGTASSVRHFYYDNKVHYTQVLASGSGAQASLTGGAAVSLSAKGTLTLSETNATNGGVSVDAGYGALGDLHTQAAGGGSANLNTKSGVGLQAGKVTLSGRAVSLTAGGGALHGAPDSFDSSFERNCTPGPCGGNTFNRHVSSPSSGQLAKGDSVTGHGSKLAIGADASLTIKAGSVSVTALGTDLGLKGGGGDAQQARITASDGGAAGVNLSNQVNITATGAVTVAAKKHLDIRGGSESRSFALKASDASANLITTAGVDITAATMRLTAGSDISMSAGKDIGSHALVQASRGTAKATQVAGIAFTARSVIGISLLGSGNEGSIGIKGGVGAGRLADVTAGSGGLAKLGVSEDVSLTVTAVGGSLNVSAGKIGNAQFDIRAGGSAGQDSNPGQGVFADRGSAGADLTGNVSLSALGAVTVNAGHGALMVAGANHGLANGARASASNGGKATAVVAGDATITGGSISLDAASVKLTGGGVSDSSLHAGNGEHEALKAIGGGVANVDVSAVTSLKATGALGVTAGGDLSIVAAYYNNGTHAALSASGGKAQANFVLDQEVDLSGGTGVTLRGSGVFVDANRSGHSGSQAQIKALANGTATMDQTAAITITTGGTFAVAATGKASLNGAQDMGGHQLEASASGGLAAAAYVADGALKVSARAVKLSAGNSLFLFGGRGAAGSSGTVSPAGARAQAMHGGSAAVSVDQSADFTAVTAFSAKLTGLGDASIVHALQIYGGGFAARDVLASASGAVSKADVTAMSQVNVVVTGTTGSITLSTGKQPHASIYVGGDYSTARNAKAAAKQHGTATVIADGDVSLSAKGAVTLTALHGSASVVGAFSKDGLGMDASASVGGKATTTADEKVSITGGSVTLNASGLIKVLGAHEAVGNSMGAKAVKGAAANVSLDAQATLTALTGALTLTASSMRIVAASNDVGNKGVISGSVGGAKAGVSLDAHTLLNGATGVSLVTTTGNMKVIGGSVGSHGGHNSITAKNGGHAGLTEDLGLSVVTGGVFTANAGGTLDIFGASHLGEHTHLLGSHAGASASAALTGTVSITAKSISINAAKEVQIHGGSSAAFSAQVGAFTGGIAGLTADAGVSLNTTGGALSIKAGTDLNVKGGAKAAAGSAQMSIASPQSNNFNISGSNFSRSVDTLHHVLTTQVLAAGNGAVANLNADAGVSLTATGAISLTQTQTANVDSITIAGGSQAGNKAQVIAASRGNAALSATAGVSIKAGGALTLKGHGVDVFGGNSAANGAPSSSDVITTQKCPAGSCSAGTQHTLFKAPVLAIGGNATAQLNAGAGVSLQAASVTVTAVADGFLDGGAFVAEKAKAEALGSGDKATISVQDALTIKAAGAITLTGSDIFIGAGPGNASSARVRAGSGFASASLLMDKSVHFTAGGAFTATAGRVGIGSHGSSSHLSLVQASGSGAKAKLDVTGSVDIAAQTLTLTATGPAPVGSAHTGSLQIAGGVNRMDKTIALDGGSAATLIDDGLSLNATGAVTLTALHGSVQVLGGQGDFGAGSLQSVQAYGGSAGTAKASLVAHNAVTINGSSLTLKAGTNIVIIGGSGNAAALNASYGGSADATLDASVKLNAGTNVSLTATHGNISIGAAAVNGLLVNVDPSIVHANSSTIGAGKPGGIVNGTLDASVTLTAGQDVNLKAGGQVRVATGAGETLAVGSLRKVFITTTSGAVTGSSTKYLGDAWGGGSAHLNADLDAAIVAGRDINVSAGTAGAGGIVVQGLAKSPLQNQGLENVVSVRGGSSTAVGSIDLTADASLTAGRDIVLNAKGNASVDGGSLAWAAADHTQGSVSLNAGAGATLHAGRNVVLNAITGSFMVGGIGVNPTHQGHVSAEADAASGKATVTAHADASVSAVGNISTVSSLGGALNVVGGGFIVAQAQGAGMSTATATGNASITAGSVAIKAVGDLNVLGGVSDAARASAALVSSVIHNAVMQAKAGITAGGQLTLSVGGSASIAGGGLQAAAIGKPAGGVSLTATGDVSTSLQGAGITLTVTKGLIMHAGGAGVVASASGSHNQATASATADASLSATGNVAITVGKKGVGDASFAGGNDQTQATTFIAGADEQATVNGTTDMLITVGGNLSLNVAGLLKIAGGNSAGFHAQVFAGNSIAPARAGVAKDEISAKSLVTAAGNLTLTLHGGDASLLGGAAAGSQAILTTMGSSGSQAQARLDVDSSLTLKAGGALQLTGAGLVTLNTGTLAHSSGQPFISGNPGTVSGKIDSGVRISGKSVNLNNGKNVSGLSNGTTSHSGLVFGGRLIIVNTGGGSPIDSAPSPLSVHGAFDLDATHALISVSPLNTGFGSVRSLSEWPAMPVSAVSQPQSQDLDAGTVQLMAPAVQTLGTLQTQGLTVSLLTMMGTPVAASAAERATLFTPGDIGSLQPASYFGSCNSVLLPQLTHSYRGSVGGK